MLVITPHPILCPELPVVLDNSVLLNSDMILLTLSEKGVFIKKVNASERVSSRNLIIKLIY